jgi:predicted amidophosphoribosyltransferase
MPAVTELSAPYGNFMLGPRAGPGVCRTCFNLTDGYDRCYACLRSGPWLDAMAPISYSVAHEQLHHALAAYKRSAGAAARRLGVELAAVLWRYLLVHEACIARAAKTDHFELVTTVPSSARGREEAHPLPHIVGELVEPTRARQARLLRRAAQEATEPHQFDRSKYEPMADLGGESVLIVDDTWTTGANAQSAAAALKAAGAGRVAAVVIGRHVNREWGQNDRRLRGLASPFDWGRCALCAPETSATEDGVSDRRPRVQLGRRVRR